MKRKLAVGWFDNESFVGSCADHVSRIKEVFFAWPGVTASRPMDDWTPARRSQIVSDLRWSLRRFGPRSATAEKPTTARTAGNAPPC